MLNTTAKIIDLVIVNYNTKALLMNCLTSIRETTELPYHIIVVDNGSHDGSIQAVSELGWADVTVISNTENLGYAKACNQGIRMGTSNYIALLNSDMIMTKGWLQPLLACFAQDEKIAVVGPKLVDSQGRINSAGIVGTNANHFPRGFMERDDPPKYEEQIDCISVCGAAYLIRRDLLNILGLFDEHYFFYFEETDYSFHARASGFRVVYCPASRLVHIGGQSNQNHDILRQYFQTSQHYFNRKWASVMADPHVLGNL